MSGRGGSARLRDRVVIWSAWWYNACVGWLSVMLTANTS